MSFFARAAELEKRGEPFAVITFTGGKGHLPQVPGAKAIVTSSGLHFGTVGGGKVEARAVEMALKLLAEHFAEPISVTWNLQRDLDMTCGGEMSFLIEPTYPHTWRIVIHGAGHVAQALVRVLAGVEAQITCVDSRSEWLEKLPQQGNLVSARALTEIPSEAYHVVVTHDHSADIPILTELSKLPVRYVGVIGSATKAGKVRKELSELGCSATFIESIRCPMGLPIGGNKPGEIAISIAAQLLEFHDKEAT